MREVTVGIDIGTTSVKAVAADADGTIVARARVPHRFRVPEPDRFEHDAERAWRRGPRRALAALGDIDPLAVSVSAMVPSLTAVDRRGVPHTPGLLYGDSRGRTGTSVSPSESGEFLAFVRWTAEQRSRRVRLLARAERRELRARPRGGARHDQRRDHVAVVRVERLGSRGCPIARRARAAVAATGADRHGRRPARARRSRSSRPVVSTRSSSSSSPVPTTTATCSSCAAPR